jgi:hypothetical protein
MRGRSFREGAFVTDPLIYPDVRDIEEFFRKLPASVRQEVDPFLEAGRRKFREGLAENRLDEKKQIEALFEAVDPVFMTRTARLLRARAGGYEEFQCAIRFDGVAELTFWCAHMIYHMIDNGRMLKNWQRDLVSHLWRLVGEAESVWDGVVPERWQKYLVEAGAENSGTVPSHKAEPVPSSAGDRKAPSDFFEAYRRQYPTMNYKLIQEKIGISRDTLFRIKEEKGWVSDPMYQAAAGLLRCQPEDLHPRGLPRFPRSGRKKAATPPSPEK